MRTLSTITPRGVCTGCGKTLATTKSGCIIQHDRGTVIGNRLEYCPGAGFPPVKGNDEEEPTDHEGSSHPEETEITPARHCDPEE